MQDLSQFPIMIVAILVALTVHEWAHAFVAWKLGDDTARWAGRLTLNPLAHLDPVGAILFLLVGFGWAKPVPVDVRNFRHPVRDAALVAVAGPLSNLILAFLAAAILTVVPIDVAVLGGGAGLDAASAARNIAGMFLVYSLRLNLALMAFNLLPIPPLDGSNILRLFIPWQLRDRYEEFMRYGPWILLGVIVVESFLNVPILSWWVGAIIELTLRGFDLILP